MRTIYSIRLFDARISGVGVITVLSDPVPAGSVWVVRDVATFANGTALGDIARVGLLTVPGAVRNFYVQKVVDASVPSSQHLSCRVVLNAGEKLRVAPTLTSGFFDAVISGYALIA